MISTSHTFQILVGLALLTSLPACADDGGDEMSEGETMGDGDGDPTGDGDGDPTGDGDGDPSGDGDGDPTGDGDGDPSGDGDGDPSGDGDGDPSGDGDGDPSGDGDGDPSGDGDGDNELTFEGDVWPILENSCSCHTGGAGGLAMPNAATAYDNLVNVAAQIEPELDRVTPGDPANSFLIQKLTGTQANPSGANEQMPKGMAALSEADQQLISDWVTDGAVF